MKKRLSTLIALCLIAGMLSGCGPASTSPATPPANSGEPTYKVGLIQLMDHPSLNTICEAIVTEVKNQGYEGTVEIEIQNAIGDSANITSIAQKFIGDEKDLIISIATPAAQAVATATKDIPQIFAAITDPVSAKLVASLDAPGGSSTGTSDMLPMADIFKTILTLTPDVKTIGLLYSTGEDNSHSSIAEAKAYCDQNGIAYVEATATNVGEVQQAAASLVGRVDAIFTPTDNTVASAMAAVTQITRENQIPYYVGADSMVIDGGFVAVGVDYTQLGRQTAQMALEVLIDGKNPAEMPVQTLESFATYINTTTAEAIGVTIPAEILATAQLFE